MPAVISLYHAIQHLQAALVWTYLRMSTFLSLDSVFVGPYVIPRLQLLTSLLFYMNTIVVRFSASRYLAYGSCGR